MKKKIIIVEDHDLVRELWVTIFSTHKDLEVVGDCGELDEAIELIKEKQPDIISLDINLKNSSGFDAVPVLKKALPSVLIVVVTMHIQKAYLDQMLELGVNGYITKSSTRAEIFKTIDEVIAGNTYVCEEMRYE